MHTSDLFKYLFLLIFSRNRLLILVTYDIVLIQLIEDLPTASVYIFPLVNFYSPSCTYFLSLFIISSTVLSPITELFSISSFIYLFLTLPASVYCFALLKSTYSYHYPTSCLLYTSRCV